MADTTTDNNLMLVTVRDACQMLAVSRPTIEAMLRRGDLKRVPIGTRGVRITMESIREWLDHQQ
jgi:excisionase family DNA binding protein